MDALGKRMMEDKARILSLRQRAAFSRRDAENMDREADEIERLLKCARMLKTIADIAEGSTTANSLPNIAKIARDALNT